MYNTKKTIDRTIESIINQTYEELEILLVDDGSTDGVSQVCDEWTKKDARIRCIHKHNEGLGLTRNRGILEAKGKYIFFIDSDDYIENNMVADMVRKAEEYNADMVGSNFFFENREENCLLKEGVYEGSEIVEYLLPRLLGRMKYGQDDFLNVSSCTKLYSVDFLRNNRITCKSEREYIWEDMVLNFDCLLKAERIYIVQKCYYHYCYNGDSLTHKYDSNKIDRIIKIYSYFQEMISTNNLADESKDRLNFSVMGNIRMCIKQVVLYCDKSKAIKEIKRICGNQNVHRISKELKNQNLSKVQVLFNQAVKINASHIVYLLAKAQNRKRGVIQ
ncbi:MAG: glycosyltransferase [Lachnospiraceae bacterium]|nr:glycosyltransferase [Lachnospiraceae bacterium]